MWRPRLESLPNWDALQSLAPTYGSLQRTVARVCSFNLLANPEFGSAHMNSRSVGLLVKGAPGRSPAPPDDARLTVCCSVHAARVHRARPKPACLPAGCCQGVGCDPQVLAGANRLGGKRCWQVRTNTWGTCSLSTPMRGEAVPQLLPEGSNKSVSLPRPPSCLVLASPAWGAPEAVQVGDCYTVCAQAAAWWCHTRVGMAVRLCHDPAHAQKRPPCTAAAHGSATEALPAHRPAAVQTVDLFGQLVQRGLRPSVAAAWLDTSPPLAVSVWVRVGGSHRGTSLEGSAVVVLDNGQDKGTATSDGARPLPPCTCCAAGQGAVHATAACAARLAVGVSSCSLQLCVEHWAACMHLSERIKTKMCARRCALPGKAQLCSGGEPGAAQAGRASRGAA